MSLEEYAEWEVKGKQIVEGVAPLSVCSLIYKLFQYAPEGEEGLDFQIGLSDEEFKLLHEAKDSYNKMWNEKSNQNEAKQS